MGVLDAVTKTPELTAIICVDDGSTDDAFQQIAKTFPQVELIKLSRNQGKSAAVHAGLSRVKTEYVFLCDADLSNIKIDTLSKAFGWIKDNRSIDMLIFKNPLGPRWMIFSAKLTRGDIIFSGQRILRLKDLEDVLNKEKPIGYQIEMAINRWMLKNAKNCYWTETIAYSPHKSEKIHSFKGWWDDLVANYEFLNKGPFDWLRIVLSFCKEEYVGL